MNARQIVSGLGWSALATAVSAVCQLGFMAVLARLLDPGAFGLMALAVLALRCASFFAQIGSAQALVQKPRLDAQDTTAALLLALAIGSALYGAMALAAPLLASAFEAPELSALVRVLGASLLLNTLGGLPLALLRREAQFKRVGAIEVTSFVLGYGGVGIAAAWFGFGVWALVAATLSQQALTLVLGFALVRYPLAWPVSTRAVQGLWAYGAGYSLVGFLEFLSANVDSMFIGRAFGKLELGLFNRAAMLANLPVELGVSAVNKVLFPALSGMQGDAKRIADGFLLLLLGIGLFSSAMACAVAVAAADLVALLLGPNWLGIAPLVSVLALAVPPLFMYVACGVTLDSIAALRPKLKLQALVLLLKVGLIGLIAVIFSTRASGSAAFAGQALIAVAVVVVLCEALRLALGLRLVVQLLAMDAARLWPLLGVFVATGAVVALGVALSAAAGDAAKLPLVARVLLELLVGAGLWLGVLALLALRFSGYAPLQRFEPLRRGLLQLRAQLRRALHCQEQPA